MSSESPYLKRFQAKYPHKKYPARMGQRWSADEDHKLLMALQRGTNTTAIARMHDRTVGAIRCRSGRAVYKVHAQSMRGCLPACTNPANGLLHKRCPNSAVLNEALKKPGHAQSAQDPDSELLSELVSNIVPHLLRMDELKASAMLDEGQFWRALQTCMESQYESRGYGNRN